MTVAVIEATDKLEGSLNAPPSKSYTHRAIIASSLAKGLSKIKPALISEDINATINASKSFGASIIQNKMELSIIGLSVLKAPSEVIYCGDSASTIRFFTPIAAILKGKTVLDGSVGLRRRPIGTLIEALRKLNVKCTSTNGFPPVKIVGGDLKGGETSLVGDVSSQFVTGLLLACPLAKGETMITVTTPLESKPYVRLTLEIIRSHGIEVKASKNLRIFNVAGGQRYMPRDHIVPGDFSSAAFLLAAAAMTNSDVTVRNLYLNQPDSEITKILIKIGAAVQIRCDSVRTQGGRLKGISIDAKDIPDLVPVCAALACVAEGVTHIFGAKRLRIKESNRLTSLSIELRKMGADIVETTEGLVIKGPCKLHGAIINPHNDHRIAMACAIAGLKASGNTEIVEAECISKSYPNFFEDLKILGAKIHVR